MSISACATVRVRSRLRVMVYVGENFDSTSISPPMAAS
jgi:hypothetical protein